MNMKEFMFFSRFKFHIHIHVCIIVYLTRINIICIFSKMFFFFFLHFFHVYLWHYRLRFVQSNNTNKQKRSHRFLMLSCNVYNVLYRVYNKSINFYINLFVLTYKKINTSFFLKSICFVKAVIVLLSIVENKSSINCTCNNYRATWKGMGAW